jgi:[ribosomal protein S18]-alanine N-acetyltransferase
MLDREAWGVELSAVLDEEGSPVGELSIEFFDENERHTDYAQYGDDVLMNARELWIGFGLRPDLVGRGRGADFVSGCADFAVERFNYRGEFIRLGVACFNERAVKTHSRAGFSIYGQVKGQIAGRDVECVTLRI